MLGNHFCPYCLTILQYLHWKKWVVNLTSETKLALHNFKHLLSHPLISIVRNEPREFAHSAIHTLCLPKAVISV